MSSCRVVVIGLTGGIASGKTTLRKFIQDTFGDDTVTIDADKLGHSVYVPGTEAFVNIVDTFGSDLVDEDGLINRRKLGSIVFADPEKVL